MYVCTYICMYVCMYVCMYICMFCYTCLQSVLCCVSFNAVGLSSYLLCIMTYVSEGWCTLVMIFDDDRVIPMYWYCRHGCVSS